MKSSDYFKLYINDKSFRFFNSNFLFNCDDFCQALNSYIEINQSRLKINHKSLAKQIETFVLEHKFDFTHKQKKLYNNLCNDDSCYLILFPYQPNFFPSISAIAPAVHMEKARVIMKEKYNKTIIPLFLLIDYDTAQDKRFSRAYFPYLASSTLKLHFNYKIESRSKQDVMFSVDVPEKETIDEWKKKIQLCTSNLINVFKKSDNLFVKRIENNQKKLFNLLDLAKNNEKTFSGFNIFILNNILIDNWDCGLFFIEGHQLYLKNQTFFTHIQKNEEILNCKFNEIHLLFQRRGIQTSFKERKKNDVFCWYYKTECNKRCKSAIDCFENCLPDYIFPDVIADYVLDYLMIGKAGSVGYYKQFEATVYSEYILGEVFQIRGAPQLLTSSSMDPLYDLEYEKNLILKYCVKNHTDFNAYIDACNDSHCSILYHILLQGFDSVFNYLKKHI